MWETGELAGGRQWGSVLGSYGKGPSSPPTRWSAPPGQAACPRKAPTALTLTGRCPERPHSGLKCYKERTVSPGPILSGRDTPRASPQTRRALGHTAPPHSAGSRPRHGALCQPSRVHMPEAPGEARRLRELTCVFFPAH